MAGRGRLKVGGAVLLAVALTASLAARGAGAASAVIAHVCGPGGLASCAASVGTALQATYDALVTANGGAPLSTWTADTATKSAGVAMPVYDDIEAQTVGLVGQPAIDWQNRPTFQQVVEFPRHRPR